MNISINDAVCWGCGGKDNITSHHALPQRMNPIQNVTIPVCRKCHDVIHFDDVSGMFSYAFKIEKQLKESSRNIAVLKKMLDENTAITSLKKGAKIRL